MIPGPAANKAGRVVSMFRLHFLVFAFVFAGTIRRPDLHELLLDYLRQ